MVLSVLLINIIRDFLIMGVRLMAFEQKTIITASFLGKLKTIFTFASILFILLSQQIKNITYLEEITLIYTMKIILIINIFSNFVRSTLYH